MPVGALVVTPGPAITAVTVGMLVTAAGALWPARRAGRISPIRAVLGTRGVRRAPRRSRLWCGLALTLPGAILGGRFWGSGNGGSAMSGLYGITLTMAMFLGIALLAPFVIIPLVRVLAVPLRKVRPAGGRLAADALLSNAGRTAATAAALTIGLSVVVVNSTLSASFMGTISDQLNASFARDFTVQAAGQTLETGGGPGVPQRVAHAIAGMPESAPCRRSAWPSSTCPGSTAGRSRASPSATTRRCTAHGPDAREGCVARGGTARRGPRRRADRAAIRPARGPGGRRSHRPARLPGDGRGCRWSACWNGVTDFNGNVMEAADTLRSVYGVTSDAQLAVRARSDAAAAPLGRRIEALLRRDYPGVELASIADKKQEVGEAGRGDVRHLQLDASSPSRSS